MSSSQLAFDALMTKAHLANGMGQLDTAFSAYGQAYDVARSVADPNWLDVTRSARGTYETGYRVGVTGSGLEYWRDETTTALDNAIHEAGLTESDLATGTILEDDADRRVVREMIQTNTTIGKITLRDAVHRERGNRLGRDMVGTGAERTIIGSLREAERLLPLVEGKGPIDQYRINWHTPAVFGERLYGDRLRAVRIAGQAVRYAGLSESPALPTSAGLHEEGRRAAASRARKRSVAAMGAVMLPRHEALVLASKAV